MPDKCRKSPIGRKTGSVNVFPEDPTQLQLTDLVVSAGQDNQWRGTNVSATIRCPGLRRDFVTELPNNGSIILHNAAGVIVGNYQGKATFNWPNGQKLVVTFNYEVKR